MSDALDKVRGISRLPIFPLPLVMLPGELLPLHIFEERYRQMLRDISLERNMFGVTLFEPEGSFAEAPNVGSIGCVAEVRESEMLADGRSNILTLGVIRYRLTGIVDVGEPYLTGTVEFFEDDPGNESEIGRLADEVFALFQRMAEAAHKMSGGRGRMPEIGRSTPEALSFLITAAFNFDNEKKYRLLEMTSTAERLEDLKKVLDRAVVQIEDNAEIQAVSRTNGHSKKKIDI